MKQFEIPVADLLFKPGARRREHRAGRRPEALTVARSVVPANSEVTVDALLEWVTDGLLASGVLSTSWEGECRRCLDPVSGEVHVEFRELFEQQPREGESYRLGRDSVELEPMVREALTLDLPLAPLCSESCRGLCVTCGAQLNVGGCGCPSADRDSRWAALDLLALEPEPSPQPGE